MEFKVKDLVNINSNSLKKSDFEKRELIRYLDTANITKGTIDKVSELNVREDKIPSRARRKVQTNDIIISTVRPNQEHYGIINESIEDVIVSTGFAVLTPNSDRVDPYYLYLKMTSKETTRKLQMIAEDSTSAYPSIKPSVLGEVSLTLPNLKIQNTISAFIQSIDQKIKINHKIIANLEELAQTLFKRWFVDFEFPNKNGDPYKSSGGSMVKSELGEMPSTWGISTINEFSGQNITTGKTPSTKVAKNYSDHGVPFITIPDMHGNIYVHNTERYISDIGAETVKNKIIPINSIMVSCIATPGLVSITSSNSITNQQINSFTPNIEALYYLYFTLKKMKNYIKDLGSGGSTTLNLNKTQFSKIRVILPDNKVLNHYHNLVNNYFKKIIILQNENNNLMQLRDTLLPKLMSGEIELPEALEV